MFETLSDSSSRTDGQDSFSSGSSAKAALKKQQLKELNNELIKENALLRSQFEEAVEITAQLQDLHKKNQDLVAENSAIQAEKEDLDHRLEISLATNRELTKKLNEEKRNHSQQNDTNLNAMNNEIDKVREQAKAQLDSVLGELEKVKSLHEKDILQQKTVVGKIDRILQSGERFFNVKLSTVDDLIGQFENTQNPKPETAAIPLVAPFANAEHNDKRLRRYKSQLKEAKQAQSSIQEDLIRAQEEVYQLQSELKNKDLELQSKLEIANEERSRIISDKDTIITSLNAQIDQLKAEIKGLQANYETKDLIISPVQHPHEEPHHHEGLASKVAKRNSNPEDLAKINQLQQNNDILEEKLAVLQEQNENAERRISDSEAQIAALKLQIDKLNTEIATSQTLKEAANKEIESLRNALHAKKLVLKEVARQPQQKSTPNVAKYQRIIEEQKGKILALNQAADKQKKFAEKQDHEIAQLNEKLNQAELQTRHVQDDFNEYRQKVESKKPLTADDVLPSDAFRCTEFDARLAACVQKIATNQSLQPVTKLQKTFKAICGHFSNNIHEIQQSLEETTKENQFLSSTFNKFIIDLSIAVADQPTTIEDFFKANGGQKLLDQVAEFRVRFDDMKHQSDRLKEIAACLAAAGFGETDDPVAQVQDLKTQFFNQSEILASKSSKLKKLHREYKEILTSAELIKSESAKRIELLNSKYSAVSCQIKQLESNNSKLTTENHKLLKDLQDCRKRIDNFEEEFKTREAQSLSKLAAEHNEKMTALSKKFQQLLTTYNELVEEFNHQDEENKKLQETVDQQKRQLAARERENAELKRKLQENIENSERRLETEKQQLADTYKGVIAELTEQCNKHRSDVERMAKEVAEAEKQMAMIKNDNCLLKKQKIKAENEMKQQAEKFEREKKILDSSYTAKRCQYEDEFTRKMTESNQKYEQDKRRICGYAAESFKLLFNANSAIDEKSYRSVIDQARDELTKLTKSDADIRRLVAARDNQTTEDAVAQVLMNSA